MRQERKNRRDKFLRRLDRLPSIDFTDSATEIFATCRSLMQAQGKIYKDPLWELDVIDLGLTSNTLDPLEAKDILFKCLTHPRLQPYEISCLANSLLEYADPNSPRISSLVKEILERHYVFSLPHKKPRREISELGDLLSKFLKYPHFSYPSLESQIRNDIEDRVDQLLPTLPSASVLARIWHICEDFPPEARDFDYTPDKESQSLHSFGFFWEVLQAAKNANHSRQHRQLSEYVVETLESLTHMDASQKIIFSFMRCIIDTDLNKSDQLELLKSIINSLSDHYSYKTILKDSIQLFSYLDAFDNAVSCYSQITGFTKYDATMLMIGLGVKLGKSRAVRETIDKDYNSLHHWISYAQDCSIRGKYSLDLPEVGEYLFGRHTHLEHTALARACNLHPAHVKNTTYTIDGSTYSLINLLRRYIRTQIIKLNNSDFGSYSSDLRKIIGALQMLIVFKQGPLAHCFS